MQERELCAQARLLPVHYLELKALMMREGQTKGYISRQEARSFFRLEPTKAVRWALCCRLHQTCRFGRIRLGWQDWLLSGHALME